jgi:hypothetical protein
MDVFSSWPDLTDQSIGHPDIEYFTDGSSFTRHGTHFAGYSIVILGSVTEAHPLPVGISAQN